MLFVYQTGGRWGSVARSRDPGLHGRRPVFATPGALARSYVDPYVDFTGRVTAYAVIDLRTLMGSYDWRLSERNVWKVERMLLDFPHRSIRSSDRRFRMLRAWYRADLGVTADASLSISQRAGEFGDTADECFDIAARELGHGTQALETFDAGIELDRKITEPVKVVDDRLQPCE